MSAVSLVTKGFIHPIKETVEILQSGSGGAGLVRRDEELAKPHILVTDVKIEGVKKEAFTEDTIRVKTVKMIVDQKD